MTTKQIRHANAYGNVEKVPKGYAFIPGSGNAALCRKHGIRHAKLIDGWQGKKKYGFRPTFAAGVVVHKRSVVKLKALLYLVGAKGQIKGDKVGRQIYKDAEQKLELVGILKDYLAEKSMP